MDSEGKKYPFLVKHERKKFKNQVFDRNIWSNKTDKPKCWKEIGYLPKYLALKEESYYTDIKF